MNDKPNIEVEKLKPFTKFIYTIGQLPTSYLLSMTYEEQLIWLCNYLSQTVIPAVNNNGEAVTEIQNLFVELEDYVNHYFDNLDIQEEINHKLDEMAVDGTLTNLIKSYVDPLYQSYENEINTLIEEQNLNFLTLQRNVNNSIDYINNKVESVTSGSPAGVYSTVEDLTEDDPDHTKIYVVSTTGDWYYYNTSTSSWDSGGTYQSSVDPDSITQLQTDVYTIVPDLDVLYDLIDTNEFTTGYYINPDTGTTGTNASYSYSDYIEISEETQYKINQKANTYAAYYNASKVYISGFKFEPNQQIYVENNITTPENAKYLRISCQTANLSELHIHRVGTATLNPLISTIAEQISDKNSYNMIKYTELNVGTGQTYETLREAFAQCLNPSYYNRYIVNFHGDGTEYNIFNEFTNAELSQANFIGRTVPQWTKLRGVGGKEKCIIGLRLETPSTYISTLNTYGSSELENLTIIGDNVRYAVHDDYPTVNAERTWKDCYFETINTATKSVVGAGSRSGDTMIFVNCVFKSNESNCKPYGCHNNINFTKPTNLYFINCRFKNSIDNPTLGVTLNTLNNNANGIINNAYFYGCYINKLTLREEKAQTYGSGILWKVMGYGNNLVSSDVAIINTDGLDYSSYIDLI